MSADWMMVAYLVKGKKNKFLNSEIDEFHTFQ